MARINKVQPIVLSVLLDNPETRADDHLLVLEVFKKFINPDMSIKTVLEHHIELGLPSFASIIRARRKLQAKYPELVNKTAAEIRAEEETEYKDYALNG